MDIIYHYPPELLQLLVEAIPLLSRSKRDVILFFRGAGVPAELLSDLETRVELNRQSITKYEIVRQVLTRLNDNGEAALGERRQILRRVLEFEDFSTCWADDQLKAKGLIAEIRRVTNVKDSFTRMSLERDKEVAERRAKAEQAQAAKELKWQAIDDARRELGALFKESNPQKRGLLLEAALNNLFKVYGIGIRDSFRVVDGKAPGVIEQIDGVIELDNTVYLVEMKWLAGPIGVEDVSRHLVRIYHRHSSRGLFISMTEFSAPALHTCVEALQRTVVSLALMEELVSVLERRGDLCDLLRQKVKAAVVDKNPFLRLMASS